MKKEYDFSKLKERKPKVLNPKETKVKVSKTIRLDGDLVKWLIAESERMGIPYQTLLNAKLREAMNLPDRVQVLVEEVLNRKKAS